MVHQYVIIEINGFKGEFVLKKYIEIKGARIHNLKNIDVKIPRNKLTIITGVSGSGKSSLAFDTLYEEGKRRYLMFSGTSFMVDSVPSFDSITGLSPAVAVEQRIIRQSNPRSTVGTKTKISNILGMLFSVYGKTDPVFDNGTPLSVAMFQKNSPKGMCVKCLGKGKIKKLNEEKLFADKNQQVNEVVLGLGKRGDTKKLLDHFCRVHRISPKQPLSTLTEEQLFSLKYGDSGQSSFMGFIPWIFHVTNGALSTSGRLTYLLINAGFMSQEICPKCGGTGLGERGSHTTIAGKTITEFEEMYIKNLYDFLISAKIKKSPLLNEMIEKIKCMVDVGLHHLSLSRPVPTLSGGEIQRLFLASYIIAEMDSILFVFDEPTIGLHEVEKQQLVNIIRNLVDRGNTVVVVEHDENFMRHADYIIDLGPDAGVYGGKKIFAGTFDDFLLSPDSRTSPYLREESLWNIKRKYKPIEPAKLLTIEHANLHNLQDVTVQIPLGLMVGIAGVSGSGKSSLISDTLVPKLKEILKSKCMAEETDEVAEESGVVIYGTEHIKRCLIIDQRPIGRSRTSCPATYTGMFDRIRTFFAKESGLEAGLFTVNSTGGCKICKGDGEIHYHVGMGSFIEVECEACGGTGYVPKALEVRVGGKNICDILAMTVEEAITFFEGKEDTVHRMLLTLERVGLGYITLGQKTPTISGGESQRIKLAKELSKGKNGTDSLYILDEPTTGLSFSDSEKLMGLMQELVDHGNTVIVTEHDPYILSNCDHIIEMGIGGGSDGGRVIATGTPQALKSNIHSVIGRYLK